MTDGLDTTGDSHPIVRDMAISEWRTIPDDGLAKRSAAGVLALRVYENQGRQLLHVSLAVVRHLESLGTDQIEIKVSPDGTMVALRPVSGRTGDSVRVSPRGAINSIRRVVSLGLATGTRINLELITEGADAGALVGNLPTT